MSTTNEQEVAKDVKLVYQTGGKRVPADPSFPFKAYFNFRPPEFMRMAFIGMHGGSEEIEVCGKTRKALDVLIEKNEFRKHPRLRRIVITSPDGIEDTFTPSTSPS